MSLRDWNSPEYKKFRATVRKRDGGKCRWPKCNNIKKIHVHHIRLWKYNPRLRFDVNNGICLCKMHHDFIKGKEELYAKLFLDIIRNTKK